MAVLSKFPLSDVLPAIPGREGYYGELDDAESERDTAVSKGLRVELTVQDHQVHLYVVHLASERGGHDKDEQRIAQASLIRRNYLPLLGADEHVVVAGDLNDHRGQPILRRLRGFDDIGPDLLQTGSTRFFSKDAYDTRWTYEFLGIRQQIDHILISRSLRSAARKIRASTHAHENHLASDHPAAVAHD